LKKKKFFLIKRLAATQVFMVNRVMAYKDNRETLSADIDKTVYEKFQTQWKARRQQKNGAAEAAIRLWVDLPLEVQGRLLAADLDANGLVELVQEILDHRIEAGRKAGLKLLSRPPHKPSQKG